MKHIKRFELFEMAMGVPKGNVYTASLVYERIINMSDQEIENLIYDQEIELILEGDFNINDFKFKEINVNINLEESDILYDIGEGPALAGMSFRDTGEHIKREDEYYIKSGITDVINIGVDIVIPYYDIDPEDLRDFFKYEKVKLSSSLSHELKHAYDVFKKPESLLSDRTEYSSFTQISFGIKDIDSFFFNLYFTSLAENLVRPSEVAASIESGEIDKEKFLDFLKDNGTYKQLRKILEYVPELNDPEKKLTSEEIGRIGYAKMKADLLKDVRLIRKRLYDSGIDEPDDDEEVVDFILELAYKNLKKMKFKILRDFVNGLMTEEDKIMRFFGISTQDKYLRNYFNKISYDNYDDFFENEIKKFIFVSDKLIKKISKLYDMAKDVNVNPLHAKITARGQGKKNESILDWELWKEMKGIKPNIKNIK